jgi:hypothetical protein
VPKVSQSALLYLDKTTSLIDPKNLGFDCDRPKKQSLGYNYVKVAAK